MSTPQDDRVPDQVAAPSVSTAPSGGETIAAPSSRRWRWGALPDHLGRARTSTVILSVLFLAVFALYLNVRPDQVSTRTTPAGGGSDVEGPVNPGVPTEPTTPEPTEEPAPTTGPDATEPPTTGTTGSTPSSSSTSGTETTTEPTTETTGPTGTSDPAEPTGGTGDQDTPASSSPPIP